MIAGVAGAAAWELTARFLWAAGSKVFDIVRTLGTTIFGADARPEVWWPAGMLLHCSVGAIWAIFYAYFFWSAFDWRPWLQGAVFSLLPALLAGLIMVPQMDVMQSETSFHNGLFAVDLGPWGPAMIVLGHVVFGFVLGTLYVRPVGYKVGRRIDLHA